MRRGSPGWRGRGVQVVTAGQMTQRTSTLTPSLPPPEHETRHVQFKGFHRALSGTSEENLAGSTWTFSFPCKPICWLSTLRDMARRRVGCRRQAPALLPVLP